MDDHALTETIDLEPMVSLNAMMVEFNRLRQESIAAHNKALATLFGEQTFSIPGVSILTRPIGSGIVSIRLSEGVADVARLAQVLETDFGMVGQTFEVDIFRFSFHYYMGQREVYELADALFKAIRLSRSRPI
jgi:selenocysteine lyase/cysteine desulfurase